MSNLGRQKIFEREYLSLEEKEEIAKKSNNRCCHCGKPTYFKYGATVEHFVPLSKGGVNRDYNLVMLCKECNEAKGDLIYSPEDYLEYLEPHYLHKLENYFDSYVTSFDFLERGNMLACDVYKVKVGNFPTQLINRRSKKNLENYDKTYTTHELRRATVDDIDKLTEYYIKYLKKYHQLENENTARLNIRFWLDFGCIYYVEGKEGIRCFVTFVVTSLLNNPLPYVFTSNVFCLYSNQRTYTIISNMIQHIPFMMMDEQKVNYVPVCFDFAKEDKMIDHLSYLGGVSRNASTNSLFIIFTDPKMKGQEDVIGDEGTVEFFKRFSDINKEKLHNWFKRNNHEVIEWMVNEVEYDCSDNTSDALEIIEPK